MEHFIGIIDSIAAVVLFVTAGVAYHTYKKTEFISSYWLIFSLAAAIGGVWAGFVGLEWLGVYPDLLDLMQGSIVVASATAFALAALLGVTELIKPE